MQAHTAYQMAASFTGEHSSWSRGLEGKLSQGPPWLQCGMEAVRRFDTPHHLGSK